MNKSMSSVMYCSAVMVLSVTIFMVSCGIGSPAFLFFSSVSILSAAAFAYRTHITTAYPIRFLFTALLVVAVLAPITAYVVRDYTFEILSQTVTGTYATYFCALLMSILFIVNSLCQRAAGLAVQWGFGSTWDSRLPNIS